MQIKGLEGMSDEQIQFELDRGGRFICYDYCFSIVVITFRRSSDILFLSSDASRIVPGLKFTLLSLVFGWWGIPWGPIYTIGSVAKNMSGGRDVTDAALDYGSDQ
ncbi:MAG: hypothetical protein K8J08_14665 [Thermoanaerobaculia bacterium]|nr:hypothetical protein [Thermoanaerobaculia bacterium]